MNRLERERFIGQELKGLWPQWSPTDAEMRVWMGVLSDYDYSAARTAVQQCFCEQAGNYMRPKPGPLLARLRSLRAATGQARRRPQVDIETCVFLECLEAPRWNVHLAGRRTGVYVQPTSRQDDLDYVRACAEPMRKRFEQLYGGHWIIVTDKPPRGELASGREPAARSAKSAIEQAHPNS